MKLLIFIPANREERRQTLPAAVAGPPAVEPYQTTSARIEGYPNDHTSNFLTYRAHLPHTRSGEKEWLGHRVASQCPSID